MSRSEQTTPSRPEQRVIRVFVSSTFRDMHDEREELTKRIFPQLRKMCEERGVTWADVDLRWGITEEQSERGEVLPIILAEIDRCRPYFIGLLGERYGWVPEDIDDELVAQQNWLEQHREKSVTELEILHGVLNNPKMANRACFYFRDPAYVDRVPADRRADFVEADPETRRKLAALKDRIRKSDPAVREDYPDPKILGERVLEDLTAAINQAFPIESKPDPLDREAAAHEAFAQSRAGVYIGRQEYFDRLDEHARGDGEGTGLVVLGESGGGKSALLANWAIAYRQSHPDNVVLMHFVGSSAASADWAAMLRRIVEEFKRRFRIEQEIPGKPDELRSAFANWLHMADACAARQGCHIVLVIDALNQLEDRDGAHDLVWLPPVIPENVRLVVSTLPGRPLEELTKRDWPTLAVQPLEVKERRQLVADCLSQHRKQLSPDRVQRVADSTQAANPLYLRALLEELRVFGSHERLDERIDHYLQAEAIPDLYGRILGRWEEDYERDRPGLVRDATTLLWAARRGLSEAELLELLGSNGTTLPRARWSPLYLAAEHALVNRSGLIGFFHDHLMQAVRDRYLPAPEDQARAHVRLADYFEGRETDARRIDELPWQLTQAKAWQRSHDLLADLSFFTAAWDANEFDVKAYWASIEAESPLHVVGAYRAVLDDPTTSSDSVWVVAALFNDLGRLGEALSLWEVLVQHHRESGDREKLQGCLAGRAGILYARGELGEAVELYKESESICRELGNRDGLQRSLGNQAVILIARGELDEAVKLLKENERICRELGNKDGLSDSLGNQALILKARGELDEAAKLHKEEERICRELGNKDGLQTSLGHQALILADRGELDEAMKLHKEAERICRELGNKGGLSDSLGNQALILKDRGELDEAVKLHKEGERICRELGNKDGLAVTLANQAGIRYQRGEMEEARRYYREAQEIFRRLGNKSGLQACLAGRAVILYARGELDEAVELYKESERICRELGNKHGLSDSLGNQALILKARGELDEAAKLHKEEERICRELGNKDGLARTLANQAGIRYQRGELDEAVELYKESERICRELGNKDGLSDSLGNQALILKARGELDEAAKLHKEEERICRELGNKDGLQTSLGHQALILADRGELDEAVKLHKESERICRELGSKGGLATSLANQAELLADKMGTPEEALPLVEEAYRLASDHGLTALAEQIEPILDSVRSKLK